LSVIDSFIYRNVIGGELYILRRLGFPGYRVFMGIIRISTTGWLLFEHVLLYSRCKNGMNNKKY